MRAHDLRSASFGSSSIARWATPPRAFIPALTHETVRNRGRLLSRAERVVRKEQKREAAAAAAVATAATDTDGEELRCVPYLHHTAT